MADYRVESDSLGEVRVPVDKLWGAQTQRCLDQFAIGREKMPPEMITAYAHLKKAAALANRDAGRLPADKAQRIVTVCDEILAHRHDAMFPLGVWMAGSGTPFHMNVNEVIANRAAELAGLPLGGKRPVHPNDDVNLSQSTNDTFPTAMHLAASLGLTRELIPALAALRQGLDVKATAWRDIVKLGRTHLQDATPLTLGQEFSGYVAMLDDNLERLDACLPQLYRITMGGTAVGTGMSAPAGFAVAVAERIADQTGLPLVTAPNKFAAQGSHDALGQLSATLKTLAVSLQKIATDIRLLACGPRAGLGEISLPATEPGSSIMPGKLNPTPLEAMVMVTMQVMANDMAVALAGAGGQLEMNAAKPLIIHNLMQSIRLLADAMNALGRLQVEGMEPNPVRIANHLANSLMLATALLPVLGHDRTARIVDHALAHDLGLREAALGLGLVDAATFDRLVVPANMIHPDPAQDG